MKVKIKSLLLPFYFGSIKDNERTLVERELLIDTEVLVDYLDLKRSLESAEIFPEVPSPALWLSLQDRAKTKRKFIISVSFGAAAAIVALITFFALKQNPVQSNIQETETQEVLFDSRNELSASSSVL